MTATTMTTTTMMSMTSMTAVVGLPTFLLLLLLLLFLQLLVIVNEAATFLTAAANFHHPLLMLSRKKNGHKRNNNNNNCSAATTTRALHLLQQQEQKTTFDTKLQTSLLWSSSTNESHCDKKNADSSSAGIVTTIFRHGYSHLREFPGPVVQIFQLTTVAAAPAAAAAADDHNQKQTKVRNHNNKKNSGDILLPVQRAAATRTIPTLSSCVLSNTENPPGNGTITAVKAKGTIFSTSKSKEEAFLGGCVPKKTGTEKHHQHGVNNNGRPGGPRWDVRYSKATRQLLLQYNDE